MSFGIQYHTWISFPFTSKDWSNLQLLPSFLLLSFPTREDPIARSRPWCLSSFHCSSRAFPLSKCEGHGCKVCTWIVKNFVTLSLPLFLPEPSCFNIVSPLYLQRIPTAATLYRTGALIVWLNQDGTWKHRIRLPLIDTNFIKFARNNGCWREGLLIRT